jgi:ornithine cyclodeaminase/alanine dehydrogenase-like protein (mu-crystallin family)
MTLLLTNEDVEQVLHMPDALVALEPVYRDLAQGRAVNWPQSQTYLPGPFPGSSYCPKTVEGGGQELGVMAIRLTSDVLRAETVDGVTRRGRGISWGTYPELADVVAGNAVGRESPNELTMFMNNFGVGIQFAALGARAYQGAHDRGLGRELPDDWFLEAIQP